MTNPYQSQRTNHGIHRDQGAWSSLVLGDHLCFGLIQLFLEKKNVTSKPQMPWHFSKNTGKIYEVWIHVWYSQEWPVHFKKCRILHAAKWMYSVIGIRLCLHELLWLVVSTHLKNIIQNWSSPPSTRWTIIVVVRLKSWVVVPLYTIVNTVKRKPVDVVSCVLFARIVDIYSITSYI